MNDSVLNFRSYSSSGWAINNGQDFKEISQYEKPNVIPFAFSKSHYCPFYYQNMLGLLTKEAIYWVGNDFEVLNTTPIGNRFAERESHLNDVPPMPYVAKKAGMTMVDNEIPFLFYSLGGSANPVFSEQYHYSTLRIDSSKNEAEWIDSKSMPQENSNTSVYTSDFFPSYTKSNHVLDLVRTKTGYYLLKGLLNKKHHQTSPYNAVYQVDNQGEEQLLYKPKDYEKSFIQFLSFSEIIVTHLNLVRGVRKSNNQMLVDLTTLRETPLVTPKELKSHILVAIEEDCAWWMKGDYRANTAEVLCTNKTCLF